MGNVSSVRQDQTLPHLSHSRQRESLSQEQKSPKRFKDRPSFLDEPAFEGYTAGWPQEDFDDDAEEFSFAVFQHSEAEAEDGREHLDDDGHVDDDYSCEARAVKEKKTWKGRKSEIREEVDIQKRKNTQSRVPEVEQEEEANRGGKQMQQQRKIVHAARSRADLGEVGVQRVEK